ncbi:RDD family protein [Microbacterium hydrocarbonoxydans]|uniref:RDD family protein n=1 Tax=Microbacterium hydrocarbonoxydans TaxID=273678 RepID=UPI00203D826C|nr:RDD family protein [Microbacterium hydrocarbonoxydans]MCM3778152.1 RDD family protein [Microbacterium hydrocarbonoxydans]
MTQPAFAPIAPINRRAIGYLIDAAIAAGIAVVLYGVLIAAVSLSGGIEAGLTTLLIGGPIVSLLLLGWFVVYTLMQAGKGSIGMRAQGLRLVSAVDGSNLGFGRALLRNVIFGLAAGIVVGYFTPLFDGSGRFQGWHDKVANALILDARVSPASVPTTTDPEVTIAGGALHGSAGGIAPAIPGLPAAQASGGFTPPPAPSAPEPFPAPARSAFTVPGESAPAPAPAAPAAPAPAPAAPAASAAPTAFGTPAAPPRPPVPFEPPVPEAGESSLIAFVPGVTQPGPPSRVDPTPPSPAPEPVSDLDPGLDETIVQRPSAPEPAASDTSASGPIAPDPVTPSAPADPLASSIPPVPAMPPVPALPVSAPAVPPPAASAPEAPSSAASTSAGPGPDARQPTTTPAFDADYDEEAELEQTRISVPGHRLIFTWDDGTRVPVSRRTIFGRNPAPEDGAVLVPVRDETLSLSKTHFEAASEASGGWVLDRHSTNGMTIVRDGQRFACPAGQRVPVRLGDAIEIGDRIVTVGGYA